MNDIFLVYVLNGIGDLEDVLGSLELIEFLVGAFDQSFKKLSLFCELQDKINWKIIFEVVVEIDDVGMLELIHDFDFSPDVVHQTLAV